MKNLVPANEMYEFTFQKKKSDDIKLKAQEKEDIIEEISVTSNFTYNCVVIIKYKENIKWLEELGYKVNKISKNAFDNIYDINWDINE